MQDLSFIIFAIKQINLPILIMWGIGSILIWLAVKKNFEPALLLPIGFGTILVNLPNASVIGENGIINWLFSKGIDKYEVLPILLFVGIGAMIDFGVVISDPKTLFFGGAAQLGIFITIIISCILGFPLKDAFSIGVIGTADGPTSILVSQKLNSNYKGAIAVAAYSYMALVPLIQPFIIKHTTTEKERKIKMTYSPNKVSKTSKIIFPIAVTLITGIISPESVGLVGFLMFGNLIRECGRLENLSLAAQGPLTNIITIFLGITVSFQMQAKNFLSIGTAIVIVLGLVAFIMDTICGIFFVKLMNLFLPENKRINPMIGAAGISAFPMSARVVQKMALKEDNQNHILMQAVGANVAGQIGSVVAGGMILSLAKSFGLF